MVENSEFEVWLYFRKTKQGIFNVENFQFSTAVDVEMHGISTVAEIRMNFCIEFAKRILHQTIMP